jgi:hypothetical protein
MGSEDGGARSLGTAYGEGVYFIFSTTYREGTNLFGNGRRDGRMQQLTNGMEEIRKRDTHIAARGRKARLVLGGWCCCLRELDWGYF